MGVQPGAGPDQAASPPQGGPPGGESPSSQALQMIQQGFEMLEKLIGSAPEGALPPQDVELFHKASEATEMLIEALTGPAQGDQPQPKAPAGGPMPANASKTSQPAGY